MPEQTDESNSEHKNDIKQDDEPELMTRDDYLRYNSETNVNRSNDRSKYTDTQRAMVEGLHDGADLYCSFAIAFIIRIFLVYYGWFFTPNGVEYTDIDYYVFSDAAHYLYYGKNPFYRKEYRYTPLLAWMLQPNVWYAHEFGKILFCVFDIIDGMLLYSILWYWLMPRHFNYKLGHQVMCLLHVNIFWLYNPIIFTVSSRGNCDSIIVFIVLMTLYCILDKRYNLAAIFYGISVHFRIYPIIYLLTIILHINNTTNINKTSNIIRQIVYNRNIWKFGIISFGVFMSLNVYCYMYLGGQTYIDEAWLYHFKRTDPKHNFSIYFYMYHLDSIFAKLLTKFAFIPQFGLIIVFSIYYYKYIGLSLFLNTYIFVTYNKVCTSQYFNWYIGLLPFVIPFLLNNEIGYNDLTLSDQNASSNCNCIKRIIKSVIFWFIGNGIWLFFAYQYEILGYKSQLFNVWLSSLIFFVINNILIYLILKYYKSIPTSNSIDYHIS